MSTDTQFQAASLGFPAKWGWLNRQTAAWASYDVASSVYFGVAPAVLLPIYFRQLMAGYENPTSAWGLLAAIAIFASGLAALGAAFLSSRTRRFPLLVAFSTGLIGAVAVLGFNPWSSLLLAALAYIAAQSFYFAATTVYESFLPDLLPSHARHKLSGFGWSLGYLGGVIAIAILLVLAADRPESPDLLEASFAVLALVGALLFAASFALMRKAGFGVIGSGGGRPRFSGLMGLLARWRQHRTVFLLLLATMLVHAAISVVVVFTTPILASRFGQDLQDLLWLLLLIHVLSVPSTFGWSLIMDRWKRGVPMTILFLAWGGVLLLLAFGSAGWMPIATVSVIGCCLGATVSTLRGLLAETVEPASSAAFFGLATVAGRLAAAIGPALFALITAWSGERAGLMVILAVLASGAVLVILHVREEDARSAGGAAR